MIFMLIILEYDDVDNSDNGFDKSGNLHKNSFSISHALWQAAALFAISS